MAAHACRISTRQRRVYIRSYIDIDARTSTHRPFVIQRVAEGVEWAFVWRAGITACTNTRGTSISSYTMKTLHVEGDQ